MKNGTYKLSGLVLRINGWVQGKTLYVGANGLPPM